MKIAAIVLLAIALICWRYGKIHRDRSGRMYSIGRLTFWFVNVHVSKLLWWRFWFPQFHRVVKGDITRIFWGPMAFKLYPKELS